MNTPNKLTVLRMIIAPVFMYFFLIESFWMRLLALGLFTIAALTDLADGYYARKYGKITKFGKFMDPLADKILVSCALVSFIHLKYVATLPTMLIIGREFFVTGLRLMAAHHGVIIAASYWAKVKTFLQLTVVGVVISYISLVTTLEHFESPWLASVQFDYYLYFNVLLWAAAAVTVWTGIDYVWKYFDIVRSSLK